MAHMHKNIHLSEVSNIQKLGNWIQLQKSLKFVCITQTSFFEIFIYICTNTQAVASAVPFGLRRCDFGREKNLGSEPDAKF